MYFNLRYDRSGALFQGKFKSEHAHTDRYLKYLIAYVHLNPLKILDPTWKEFGIKNKVETESYLEQYEYSSYIDYLGKGRPQHAVINTAALPQYFESPKAFKANMHEWLSFRDAT